MAVTYIPDIDRAKSGPFIIKAFIRRYRDNGLTKACVEWSDGSRTESRPLKHKNSCFLLRPSSLDLGAHMDALFARARREGVTIGVERW